MVEPGDRYQKIVGELKEKLRGLRDPKTGRTLFDIIYTKDEIYSGPYFDMAPDIVFFDSTMTYRAHRLFEFGSRSMIAPDPIYSGSHRMDGVLIAGGPDIAQGADPAGARLLDLAPTIAHLLGLPVPSGMDGRVLAGLFRPSSRFASQKVQYLDEGSAENLRRATRSLLKAGKRL